MALNMKVPALPTHIAYSQGLNTEINYNLSNSCARTMTVAQLCRLADSSLAGSSLMDGSLAELPLSYASLSGAVALRQEIVRFHNELNRKAYGFDEANVLTFCGAQEALAAIYTSLLEPGDEIVVFTPNYPSLVTMAEEMGVKVKTISLQECDNWRMEPGQLAAQVNDKTKLIVINSPHNPSGAIIDSDTAKQVLTLAQKHNCYLLSDDVSQASNYHGLSLAHDYLSYEKSLVVGVMSKSFGLAGVRIGWVLSPDKNLLAGLLAVKAYGSICTSVLDERLAIMALQHRDKILAQNNRIISDNIKHFQHFVDRNAGLFAWQPPRAGIMVLVKSSLKAPIKLWGPELARKHKVLVLPAFLFGLEGEYFRLGLGQQDFLQGISALQAFVDNYR
ncbi:aminotransferase class I/II-fold pyridoxal phosphate-dependent enzyme [Thalassomonas viridans]|uniref:Aminotransferase class I/II-fold pyridoxal phosphate-dependent enzyme n=1 Tax=Thalassomonas viridans TaxID=137584 RepID=A0AAE9Z345_9GAMM|nr:aminotransferase class I/II-fold pyridoxal phosphate-dependent enzyme [Thalassomonas viridans]WDE05921.1 aminotransferase class I/II-fold pyridoxal phosphate-dependent enzyme [Thalassomonas viridans]